MNRGRLELAWDVIQHFTDRLALEYGIEASGEIHCCDDLGYLVIISMRRNSHTCTVEHEHGDPWWACKIAAYRALTIVGEVLHESRSCYAGHYDDEHGETLHKIADALARIGHKEEA